MRRALLIDPFSGASGDMLLSSMFDAGASIDTLRAVTKAVDALSDVEVDLERVARGAITATRLIVRAPHEHAHRGLGDIEKILAAADIADTVRERAVRTFRRLAEAEAKVHGTTVEKIHFHEVGAIDAILDITGFFAVAESLGIERFLYTTLVLGSGTVQSQHGEIPVPAPATVELLTGHRVQFSNLEGERVTPTAAAIVAAVFEPVGAERTVVPESVGYGAGSRDYDGLPNVLRAIVGHEEETPRTVTVIRCTIDDMSPEVHGHTMQALFEAGALEVYHQPVMMKKNRPGVELTVIAEDADADRIAAHVITHTTTLGVRVAREGRVEVPRRAGDVETEFGIIRVKVATLPDGSERMSPEYESCRDAAGRHGVPILDVYDAARRSWARGKS